MDGNNELPRLKANAAAVQTMVAEIGSLFASMNVLQVKPEMFSQGGKKVAYHAPCHLCRGLRVTREPRELIITAGMEYWPAIEVKHIVELVVAHSLIFLNPLREKQ